MFAIARHTQWWIMYHPFATEASMKILARLTILAAICACTSQADSDRSGFAAQQSGTPRDAAAVQTTLDSSLAHFRTAMLAGDAEGMASIFADDAILLMPNTPAISGKPAIVETNRQMLSALDVTDASFRTTDLLLSGDHAIETGVYTMAMVPSGGTAVSDTGKYVTVWSRQPGGGWKIVRDIMNSSLPAAH